MTRELKFPGLRVVVKIPRVVSEGVGFCWYPDIMRFPSGELVVTHSLNADSGEQLVTAETILMSQDEGQTWDFAYDANGVGGRVRVTRPDGTIAGPGFYMQPDPPGQHRNFVLHYWQLEQGGRRYTVEPWGARVEGLPRDMASPTIWSRWCHVGMALHGTAVETSPGVYVATAYGGYVGDTRATTEALVSQDYGRTWRYHGTVAGPDAVADANEGFDEACMVSLENGDLMCVGRVGAMQPLARTYSSDGGSTWTPPDRLPIGSVCPSMTRLDNGVIAISAGRPGISLGFSDDPRGDSWQVLDVADLHNSLMDPPHHIRLGRPTPEGASHLQCLITQFDLDDPFQTTGYTQLLAMPGNRLFLVYDRIPYGWMPVPTDAEIRSRIQARYPIVSLPPDSIVPRERERIYLLEIEVYRD